MAVVTYQTSQRTLTDPKQIQQALRAIGIDFESWGVDRLPAHLRDRNLTDAEKQQVIEAYKPELDRLRATGGYVTADVVSLYPDTPNLDTISAKFDKRHLHTEDEVRFVVQGRGVFTLYPEDGEPIAIELRPGDFISVPAKYHHLFTLCEDKQITCIRSFVAPAGWVAHYVN